MRSESISCVEVGCRLQTFHNGGVSGHKRHHYLPQFLLRRFAVTEGRWAGHVWRLDLRTGQITPAVPRTEASRNRYYKLPEEVAGGFDPETLIGKIESD